MPDNKWKFRWNLWIALLLVYTGIFVPLRVAFYDDAGIDMIIFECFVDACFFMDVILTFFSAYDRHDGLIEVRHKVIAITYLKMWFWIDVGSSIPFQLFELKQDSGDQGLNEANLKLARFARLPRLYRIVRILRLFKMFRFLRANKQLRAFTELFQVTSGLSSIVWLLVTILFLTHVVACLWFMQAKWAEFPPDCWVV